MKGVPIRLEFGPRDLDNETCVLVRRDTREKEVCKLADANARVQELLMEIQQNREKIATSARLSDEKLIGAVSDDATHFVGKLRTYATSHKLI